MCQSVPRDSKLLPKQELTTGFTNWRNAISTKLGFMIFELSQNITKGVLEWFMPVILACPRPIDIFSVIT